MSEIEVKAVDKKPGDDRHRGFNVSKNGRVVRTVQSSGEAHGLAAKMEADEIEAARIKSDDVEADCDEADITDQEGETYSPGPKL